jgi:hydroxymethylbilane synthase
VDTRIRRVREGAVDATLLARAGLVRLGLEGEIAEVLPTDVLLPAAAQGALAVVVSAASPEAMEAVAQLDDAATRAEVDAERGVLSALGGGCHLPLGCLGRVDRASGRLVLRARVVSADGLRKVEDVEEGSAADAAGIGARLGARLVAAGARELLPSG